MENVARLHRALVDSLMLNRPDALSQPVTVAEIYQDLIPYRSVKAPLGFALNADYEHTLLQLLAGEHGFVRIEPTEVREALTRELKSPNPDVGLFRDYASCDVFVTLPEDSNGTRSAPEPERAAPRSPEPAPRVASESWEAAVNGTPRIDATEAVKSFAKRESPAPVERAEAPAASAMPACASCTKPLPAGKNAHFCPFCG